MKKHILFIAVLVCLLTICISYAAADGWTKEGDHLLYYKDNSILTGTQKIDGNIYSFTTDGYLKGNGKVQCVGGAYYYLNSSNLIQYGWQKVGSKKYYFTPETGTALRDGNLGSSYAPYNGNRSSGGCYASWEIDGNWFVFDYDGVLLVNKWNESYTYYGNKEGKALSGYKQVGKDYYFFNEYGESQSGFNIIDGTVHYFSYLENKIGLPEVRGWFRIASNWYYFDLKTGIMKTGPFNKDDQSYYFYDDGTLQLNGKQVLYNQDIIMGIDSNGDKLKGLHKIGKYTYYFEKYNYDDIKAVVGFWHIGKDEDDCYCFDKKGRMIFNDWCLNNKGQKQYYCGSDGKVYRGWKTIDGNTYYMDPDVYYGGVYEIEKNGKSKYYIFDNDGKLIGKSDSNIILDKSTGSRFKYRKGEVSYKGPIDKSVTKVKIPSTCKIGNVTFKVTRIDSNALKELKKLKQVSIGNNITTIGKYAFYGCTSLEKVSGGSNVKTIDSLAFMDCKALKSFTFGKEITVIGQRAFDGCKKLKKITFKTTKLTKNSIGKNAFNGIYSKPTVKCPKDKLKDYKTWLTKVAQMPKKAKYTK